MNILVLETSTTSAKALLYNTKTQAYQWESEPFDKLVFDGTTHMTHQVFSETINVASNLLKRLDFKEKIDVISIVTTWHSLIVSDKDFTAFTKCYLWSSQIGEPYLNVSIDVAIVNQKTGCVASSMYPFYKLQKLKSDGLLKADSLVLDQGSYNYYQLTNKLLTTAEMASGTGLYNSEEAKYDGDLLSVLGLQVNQLPKVYSGEKNTYNSVSDHRLDQYISHDTLVLPAMPDGAMNQLGSVGFDQNKMTVSVGTSGALRVLGSKHLHSQNGSTWSYSLNGQALIGAATSGACNCIDQVKHQFFDQTSYVDIEELLSHCEHDLNETMYLPFIYGERSPGFNNNRRSGFVGPNTLPINMYKIALEGVLYNLYHCYKDVINLVGKPKEIHLSGGILNSKFWTQMCCDIFNEPMIIDKVIHSSLFGGVVFACRELGLDIHRLFTDDHETILPNSMNNTYYKKRFELYLSLYNQG